MRRNEAEREKVSCPVGRFFADLEKRAGRGSKFFDHLSRSRLEFLKAVRSLLDERIEEMEKKGAGKGGRRAKRIDVE